MTLAVAENLHLDVAGMLDKFFEEDAAFLEIVFRQPADRGERRGEFRRFANQRHADAAATGGALQHHRIADARGFGTGVLLVTEQFRTGQQRNVVLLGDGASGVLQTEHPHLVTGRPDEDHAGRSTGVGEPGILREKTVPGMDRLRAH